MNQKYILTKAVRKFVRETLDYSSWDYQQSNTDFLESKIQLHVVWPTCRHRFRLATYFPFYKDGVTIEVRS